MMESEQVKQMIETRLPGSEAIVSGDGYHFEAIVISDEFTGKNPVQKQRVVYDVLSEEIKSGELHALSLKTFTKDAWAQTKSTDQK